MLAQPLQRDQTTAPAPLIISELKIGSAVRGWLLVTGLQTRLAVTGMPYLYLKMRDLRGNEIVARQFDPPRLEALAPREGKVLLREGVVEEYLTYLSLEHVDYWRNWRHACSASWTK